MEVFWGFAALKAETNTFFRFGSDGKIELDSPKMFLAARALVTLCSVVQAREFLTRKTSEPDFSIFASYFDQNRFFVIEIAKFGIAENGVEKEMKIEMKKGFSTKHPLRLERGIK